MKICIVTRMDYNNYGNRLQNYALTMLLQDEGWDTYSGIEVRSKEDWEKRSTKSVRIIKHLIPFWMFQIKAQKELSIQEKQRKTDKRRAAFISFTDKYIHVLPPFIVKNGKDLSKKIERYKFDYYIVGSDQVWNPAFSGRDYEFLTFAPKEKRLSFSASFGVDDIPEKQKERYADALNGMRYISVREEQGIHIARSLTGREDIDLTLDPTLLLDNDKWDRLIQNSGVNKPPKYIATYFLGEFPNAVIEFAQKHNLPILMLNSKKTLDLYSVDPTGFLDVLHDADYIFTDSFHALAFSLKFHKEFYVFERKEIGQANMFSRLNNLLELFDLTERIVQNDKIVIKYKIHEQKWEKIDSYLLSQKRKSINMLKKQMNMDA